MRELPDLNHPEVAALWKKFNRKSKRRWKKGYILLSECSEGYSTGLSLAITPQVRRELNMQLNRLWGYETGYVPLEENAPEGLIEAQTRTRREQILDAKVSVDRDGTLHIQLIKCCGCKELQEETEE